MVRYEQPDNLFDYEEETEYAEPATTASKQDASGSPAADAEQQQDELTTSVAGSAEPMQEDGACRTRSNATAQKQRSQDVNKSHRVCSDGKGGYKTVCNTHVQQSAGRTRINVVAERAAPYDARQRDADCAALLKAVSRRSVKIDDLADRLGRLPAGESVTFPQRKAWAVGILLAEFAVTEAGQRLPTLAYDAVSRCVAVDTVYYRAADRPAELWDLGGPEWVRENYGVVQSPSQWWSRTVDCKVSGVDGLFCLLHGTHSHTIKECTAAAGYVRQFTRSRDIKCLLDLGLQLVVAEPKLVQFIEERRCSGQNRRAAELPRRGSRYGSYGPSPSYSHAAAPAVHAAAVMLPPPPPPPKAALPAARHTVQRGTDSSGNMLRELPAATAMPGTTRSSVVDAFTCIDKLLNMVKSDKEDIRRRLVRAESQLAAWQQETDEDGRAAKRKRA